MSAIELAATELREARKAMAEAAVAYASAKAACAKAQSAFDLAVAEATAPMSPAEPDQE